MSKTFSVVLDICFGSGYLILKQIRVSSTTYWRCNFSPLTADCKFCFQVSCLVWFHQSGGEIRSWGCFWRTGTLFCVGWKYRSFEWVRYSYASMQGLEVMLPVLWGSEWSKLNMKSGNLPVTVILKCCETCNPLFCWQTVRWTRRAAQIMFLTENGFFARSSLPVPYWQYASVYFPSELRGVFSLSNLTGSLVFGFGGRVVGKQLSGHGRRVNWVF